MTGKHRNATDCRFLNDGASATDLKTFVPFRKLLRAICMTACDLSACTKPWEIQLEIVRVIYQEFYAEVRFVASTLHLVMKNALLSTDDLRGRHTVILNKGVKFLKKL